MSEANLRNADLRRANFSEIVRGMEDDPYVTRKPADVSGADLRGGDLRQANLCKANFTGADLRGAKLDDALVDGANFQGADLREIPSAIIAWLQAQPGVSLNGAQWDE